MGIKDDLIKLAEDENSRWRLCIDAGTQLFIDNCRCIKSCDENYITLSVNGGCIRITGTSLTLECYGGRGVTVSGKIHSVTIEED